MSSVLASQIVDSQACELLSMDFSTHPKRIIFRNASQDVSLPIALRDDLLLYVGAGHGRLPYCGSSLALVFHEEGRIAHIICDDLNSPNALGPAQAALVGPAATFERLFECRPVSGRWFAPAKLRTILRDILASDRQSRFSALYVQAKGIELACGFFEHLRADALTPQSASATLSEADARRIMLARALIDDRLQDPLCLDFIARTCGVNRAKLTKGFSDMFGTTVGNYLKEVRMQRARDLLLTTDLLIAKIAEHTGFSNNSSFTRAFLRRFGMAPTSMRIGCAK